MYAPHVQGKTPSIVSDAHIDGQSDGELLSQAARFEIVQRKTDYSGSLVWPTITTTDQRSMAYAIYKPLADKGNAQAQLRIGVMLYKGSANFRSVPADIYIQAIDNLKKAAAQGVPEAIYNLGFIEHYKDIDLAMKYYEKAGALGFGQAFYRLGQLWMEGNTIHQCFGRNEARGIDYLKKAAELGDRDAHFELIRFYNGFYGGKPDPKQVEYYQSRMPDFKEERYVLELVMDEQPWQ